ncbi:flavodoxin [soil metagenome]
MKVLLAYATYSSGTDLASQLVTDILTEKNIAVERKDIRSVEPVSLREYDYVIFASPSWRTRKGDGQPHEFFLDFMDKTARADFSGVRFAIFGLGDKAYTHFGGAVDELVSYVKERGGEIIGEPLKIDGFYFNQHENEKILSAWTIALLD